jgi:thermitase
MTQFKLSTLLRAVALTGLLSFASYAQAAEYLVKYRNASALRGMFNLSLNVTNIHEPGQLLTVHIDDAEKISTMVNLLSNVNVEYVVPNFKLYAITQTPYRFGAVAEAAAPQPQWALEKVGAQKAWDKAGNKGNRKVVMAVIDTGVDYNHPNLKPNMVPGYDFAQNDNDPMDTVKAGANPGHGTHCAGIAGATGLIDGGVSGLSPEVSIMPIRFLTEDGSGTLQGAIMAIDYAIEKKVDIMSNSWGAEVQEAQATPLIEAVKRAEAAGIVFVAAAGNSGKNNDTAGFYPANVNANNVINVGASDQSDAKPSWSNFGQAKVHVASPGDNIMSTLPSNKYGALRGTSMAAPLVSGLVALIKASDMSLKPSEIRSVLQAAGDTVSISNQANTRINAGKALEMVTNKTMFLSPYAGTFGVNEKVQFTAVYGAAPFTFVSSNPAVATIDASGAMTAVAQGDTVISVTDANGVQASSTKIFVGSTATPPPPGDGGECPLGDPAICEAICQIMPDAPWCKQ